MISDDVLIDIAQRYETPMYVYNLKIIEEHVKQLKDALGDKNNLYYSVKANPNMEILSYIKKLNVGVEVSSLVELKLVQKVGFERNNIIFSGPAKKEQDLKYIIESGIRCINVESVEELKRIEKVNNAINMQTSVALRISPNQNVAKSGMKMTGILSQFGIEIDNLGNAIECCLNSNSIKLVGIHLYNGTQLLEANDILNNVRLTVEYVKKIQNDYNIKLKFVDFGGGFGVPYFDKEQALDIMALKTGMIEIMNENSTIFDDLFCVFESGRYIVAEAGIYITSIVERKMCQQNTYLICDGGTNHYANSAFLGRIIRGNFPVSVINRSSINNDEERVTIVGPLCTPTDIIARNILVKKSVNNDLVIIKKAGAYGVTNSPLMFILNPFPTEVIINEGKKTLVSSSLKYILGLLEGAVDAGIGGFSR